MKKQFYLFVFFFAVTLCSQAQIKKGDILLGGNVGFSMSKSTPEDASGITKQSSVGLFPSIGKAIKDNLLAGIDLIYTGSNYTQDFSTGFYTSKSYTYGAGFFLRRYKYLGTGFSIFVQGRLSASYYTSKNTYAGTPNPSIDDKGYFIDLGFYPGISYAITKRVQIETGFQNLVGLNYSHSKNRDSESGNTPPVTTKTNSFSLVTGSGDELSGFVIGLKILLGS